LKTPFTLLIVPIDVNVSYRGQYISTRMDVAKVDLLILLYLHLSSNRFRLSRENLYWTHSVNSEVLVKAFPLYNFSNPKILIIKQDLLYLDKGIYLLLIQLTTILKTIGQHRNSSFLLLFVLDSYMRLFPRSFECYRNCFW
jgi:hypothetical protein